MIAKLHIPYGFGDCVNGFKYEGIISDREYARKMVDEYNRHKDGIDDMMRTTFQNNMAANYFQKENNVYKQQKQEFGELLCYIDTKDFKDMKIEQLLDKFESGDSFVMVVRVHNVKALRANPDIEIDLKSWQKECIKIDRLPKLNNVEKFKSLSKKDLKITFDDQSKMAAILKDCKMVSVFSNTKFALWVSKIIFIKDTNKK